MDMKIIQTNTLTAIGDSIKEVMGDKAPSNFTISKVPELIKEIAQNSYISIDEEDKDKTLSKVYINATASYLDVSIEYEYTDINNEIIYGNIYIDSEVYDEANYPDILHYEGWETLTNIKVGTEIKIKNVNITFLEGKACWKRTNDGYGTVFIYGIPPEQDYITISCDYQSEQE